MSAEKYVCSNKGVLLSIYSQISSALDLECLVFGKNKEEENKKKSCRQSIICMKYLSGEVDFPINEALFKASDGMIADELYNIILCEEFVTAGKFTRSGDLYEIVSKDDFKSVTKFKKYLKAK